MELIYHESIIIERSADELSTRIQNSHTCASKTATHG